MVITVLSGKGGTGKTTIAAAISELASKVVQVDCDVDAPNLYLLYQGTSLEKKYFYGTKKAVIHKNLCIECRICDEICKFGAITNSQIDQIQCEGCGACVIACPQNAILLKDIKTADTYLTQTKQHVISRAEMKVGSDGSGKLVTELRKNATKREEIDGVTILDGSPGIGCTVIASITNTDAGLIVTEPTQSGLSDLKRILELSKNFDTKIFLCINKYDLHLEMSQEIEKFAIEQNIPVIGKIPFDQMVMKAVNSLCPITQFEDSSANKAITEMWNRMKKELQIK